MRTLDLLRDSMFGRVVYYASGRRLFQHPEDRPDFILPPRYAVHLSTSGSLTNRSAGPAQSDRPLKSEPYSEDKKTSKGAEFDGGIVKSAEKSGFHMPHRESTMAQEVLHVHPRDEEKADLAAMEEEEKRVYENPDIVDWYSPDDPECPESVSGRFLDPLRSLSVAPQWSFVKRCYVTFQIGLLTFAIYVGSSIYAPGIPDLAQKFGISTVAGSLGITMFVLGYAIGPVSAPRPYFDRRSNTQHADDSRTHYRTPAIRQSTGVCGHAAHLRTHPDPNCVIEEPWRPATVTVHRWFRWLPPSRLWRSQPR